MKASGHINHFKITEFGLRVQELLPISLKNVTMVNKWEEKMSNDLKVTKLQEDMMQAMHMSQVDPHTMACIMVLLPLEEQQKVLLAWVEKHLKKYGTPPNLNKYPTAVETILKHIPTPKELM